MNPLSFYQSVFLALDMATEPLLDVSLDMDEPPTTPPPKRAKNELDDLQLGPQQRPTSLPEGAAASATTDDLILFLKACPYGLSISPMLRELTAKRELTKVFAFLLDPDIFEHHLEELKSYLPQRVKASKSDDLKMAQRSLPMISFTSPDDDGTRYPFVGPRTEHEYRVIADVDWLNQMIHARFMQGKNSLMIPPT